MSGGEIPDGFRPYFRKSPITDPWEPLYEKRSARSLTIGLRAAPPHTNARGFVHAGLLGALYLALLVTWRLQDPWWLVSMLSFLPMIPVVRTVERIMARLHGSVVNVDILPDELLGISEPRRLAAPSPAAPHPADVLFNAMVKGGESFWTAVYRPFMGRDLTRKDLQRIIGHGLEQTRGNYRSLVELFNMPADDYKRFLNFLRKHEAHMAVHEFRTAAPPHRWMEPLAVAGARAIDIP